ncbi:Copper-sensing two-component system response regulator CpxR [Klebsiella pneumoniae]|uniref:Copper-sensing two-component system response regulator CpxR n=1 Tax=Klebsiella pneumoniae TaxID=573 RepID=A0A377WCA9_KLEPN|nr:Copper-sensing two-component system response regulator CpxR [Klebsiella pneumoniae]
MTICLSHSTIASWWPVYARFCGRSHWSEQQQTTEAGSPTLEVDALSLNPGRQEANFDGQTLELTGTEFTLLYLLAQHLGQVVSREHLSQEVLGKRLTPFDRAIDMHIPTCGVSCRSAKMAIRGLKRCVAAGI